MKPEQTIWNPGVHTGAGALVVVLAVVVDGVVLGVVDGVVLGVVLGVVCKESVYVRADLV